MRANQMNILITGAAKGLGLELTGKFLDRGHRVFALSRNPSEELTDLQNRYTLPDGKQQLIFHQADVSRESSVLEAKKVWQRDFDTLDILINNAAVHLEQDKPDILDIDIDVYAQTFAINSLGPLLLVKHFLPFLQSRESKSIINISSEAGSIGSSNRKTEYSYCMSKAALNMAMKILHNRLQPEGIDVLLIHPGWVRTSMGGSAAHLSPEESADGVFTQIMKNRTPDDPMYIDWTGAPLEW